MLSILSLFFGLVNRKSSDSSKYLQNTYIYRTLPGPWPPEGTENVSGEGRIAHPIRPNRKAAVQNTGVIVLHIHDNAVHAGNLIFQIAAVAQVDLVTGAIPQSDALGLGQVDAGGLAHNVVILQGLDDLKGYAQRGRAVCRLRRQRRWKAAPLGS